MKDSSVQYKVDINPSYEWLKEAASMNISHRELEVFALITEGYSNKEIADILKIKHQSVKNHMHHFTKKLNVNNNTQALVIALHMNLIRVRAKYGKGIPPIELTGEGYIDSFRQLVSGESNPKNLSEKEIRKIKVWLKEHGIDPYNW
jgi:DNA-binding CsgD family transcriptional regulator